VIAPQILDHLADVFDPHTSQMRIILEKPFGHDEASATTLFAHLFSRYPRSSLYFLDHYLGKQTLRDLALRDGTSFLSELLALDNIASIEISAIETLDAGSRIGYFDGVGTIEDMMQSHLIQMLAFACLDTSTRSLRAKKIDVLSSLRFSQDKKDIILGQYDEYRGHDTRVSTSDTETYAAIRCTLLHGEESVPVFLRSGKSLHQKSTYIHIHLKDSIIAHAGCE
jgi:glucose-6-phosphate 1-dehydrogenase